MGTSNLKYYENKYQGTLTDEQCATLEQFLSVKEDGGVIPDLLHVIYNLSDASVLRLIEDYKLYGRTTIDVEKPVGTLRDYQTIGVGFMFYAENCILGDSVGMGKTVEVSGLLNLLSLHGEKVLGHKHRYLFVTEKKVVSQVHKELIKFTGQYVYDIPDAGQKCVEDFTVDNNYHQELDYNVVGTHGLLKMSAFISWIEQYKQVHGRCPFDTLIVDESSVLGGSSSQIVKSFKILRRYFTRVYFLNATPLESRLDIMYNQLNLLDDKYLPTKANFQREYCVMDYTGMFPRPTNKYKNVEQFKKAISFRYFASTRRENGAVMDNCHGGIITSSLSVDQKRLLRESQLTQMIFDCPSYIDDSIPFDEKSVPKLASLRNVLEEHCANADSIIIYVHFREAQAHISDWLTSNGYSNRVLNGDTSDKDSNAIIDGFKNSEFRILITNVQKGLNFGNCDYCIFYSIISSPSEMVQFEGRMTRSFDIYDKHVYMLCSLGREYDNLRTTVKDRAEAMENMTNTDYSVVLAILQKLKRKAKK